MPDFPELPIITPPGRPTFPELPIVTPDPPRLTLREKYGSLYYLGIGGLILALAMVGNFTYQIWQTRDLWAAIFVLGNPGRPEPERARAAWAMTHHPSALDVQRMEIAFNKDLPDLIRYIVAEGLTTDAIRSDPKAYAEMVAKSEGWPNWLRLVLIRPMAYGVGEGYRLPWEPLDSLRQNKDQGVALWASYTRAVMGAGDPPAAAMLDAAAHKDGFFRPLAVLLDQAARLEGSARAAKLDEATAWLREHHPWISVLWQGWEVRGEKLVRKADPATP